MSVSDARRIKTVSLGRDELCTADEHIREANRHILGRSIGGITRSQAFRFIQRNYYQIVESDSLYAVGWLCDNTDKQADGNTPLRATEGGTAWAAALFALRWSKRGATRATEAARAPSDCSKHAPLPMYFYC